MAAVKYLSLTGLQYFYTKLESTFLKSAEFPTASTTTLGGIKLESDKPTLTITDGVLSITADNLQNVYGFDPLRTALADAEGVTGHNGLLSKEDQAKLNGIAAGAQVNVIETVKVNGTALIPDDSKAVDVTVPTTVAALTDAADYHKVADFNTAIARYSTTDQMNTAIDTKVAAAISAVYKPAGSVDAVTELPALSADVLGNVYNLTAAGTTTADFVEGAGAQIAVGANIVVVDTGTTEAPVYKFDILAGVYEIAAIENTDIDALFTA